MKFSQSVDLALHAMWYMACNCQDKPVMTKDLAVQLRASESYLARVMLWLSRAGLLKSIRGKKGGFTFKMPPSDITVADVIVAIDTDTAEYTCTWEERGCEVPNGCALVHLFHKAREQMLDVLRTMSIADMAEQAKSCKQSPQWLIPLEPLASGSEISDTIAEEETVTTL